MGLKATNVLKILHKHCFQFLSGSHKEGKTFIMQNVIYEKGPLKKAHLSSKVSQGEG